MNFILPDSNFCFDTKQVRVEDYENYISQLGASDQFIVAFDLSKYWFCDLTTQPDILMNAGMEQSCLDWDNFGQKKKPNIDEMYLNSKVTELIQALNELTCNEDATAIHHYKKINRKVLSKRKSKFIGVSKNGPNWQAMISILKRKVYFGNFPNSEDAAETFDFYSILIHQLEAKVNFCYSKKKILSMLSSFKSNGNKFISSK